MPTTLEFAPIVACNMRCPGCPSAYTLARRKVPRGMLTVREQAPLDNRSAASRQTAVCVLERAAEAGVTGVLWTGGGEPLLYEPLLEMIEYSAKLGMVNCLYTNGVELGFDDGLAPRLLDPALALVFVRVSINAVGPEAVRRHWGVRDHETLVEPQFLGLERLLEAREKLVTRFSPGTRPLPSIQISTIMNEHNIDDLSDVCERVANTFAKHPNCRATEDVMVVRPMTKHGTGAYVVDDTLEPVVRQVIEICGAKGTAREAAIRADLPMFLGFGLDKVEEGAAPSYAAVLRSEYASRDYAWANGLFLTVGPDGSVHLCTEHNCDPNWAMGSLVSESVRAIYQGERRRTILAAIHSVKLGPSVLEPNTRASRLDRIARAIQAGTLTDPQIEVLREAAKADPPLLLS